jgi:hypothetical protein
MYFAQSCAANAPQVWAHVGTQWLYLTDAPEVLKRVELLLGSDLETDNETTFAARQHIINKHVYATVTG